MDDKLYVVEIVLRYRTNKKTGKREVFVKWKNYGKKFNSWEPCESIIDDGEGKC